jgi:hypothetical protein
LDPSDPFELALDTFVQNCSNARADMSCADTHTPAAGWAVRSAAATDAMRGQVRVPPSPPGKNTESS